MLAGNMAVASLAAHDMHASSRARYSTLSVDSSLRYCTRTIHASAVSVANCILARSQTDQGVPSRHYPPALASRKQYVYKIQLITESLHSRGPLLLVPGGFAVRALRKPHAMTGCRLLLTYICSTTVGFVCACAEVLQQPQTAALAVIRTVPVGNRLSCW
jgi:hypothetical protein